jgi:hypothetical protein
MLAAPPLPQCDEHDASCPPSPNSFTYKRNADSSVFEFANVKSAPTAAVASAVCLRLQVGLHKEFYDISSWPQELQQQTVAPAVAAAAKGQGMQVPAAPQPPQAAAGPQTLQQQGVVQNGQQPQSVNGGTMQQLMSASAVPDAGPELEVLRQRLWDMLQSEADACNM